MLWSIIIQSIASSDYWRAPHEFSCLDQDDLIDCSFHHRHRPLLLLPFLRFCIAFRECNAKFIMCLGALSYWTKNYYYSNFLNLVYLMSCHQVPDSAVPVSQGLARLRRGFQLESRSFYHEISDYCLDRRHQGTPSGRQAFLVTWYHSALPNYSLEMATSGWIEWVLLIFS